MIYFQVQYYFLFNYFENYIKKKKKKRKLKISPRVQRFCFESQFISVSLVIRGLNQIINRSK
jgi:hypothetical protein